MTYTEKSYQNKPIYTIGGSHEYIYLDKIGTAEEVKMRQKLQGECYGIFVSVQRKLPRSSRKKTV